MSDKRVLIIYTGGTIGMSPSANGYKVEKGWLEHCLTKMPAIHDQTMPVWNLLEYESLIDSSNASIAFWQQIANDIAEHYDDYDGFIVLHGTDTMAYSASMLSYLLDGLAKPVIFTGAQVPLSEVRSDGNQNLINSLYIAAEYKIPEVCIYFNDVLLRANRAIKASAERFSAFQTPNYPKLAKGGITIAVNEGVLLPMPDKGLSVAKLKQTQVACYQFFPGMGYQVLEALLASSIQAVVLETFGAGHTPSNPKLLSLLHEASASGVVLVNCTQCMHGRVDMSAYSVGSELLNMGLVSAGDMTVEASVTKLQYLLSKESDVEKVKQLMAKNLRGERS